MLSLPEKGFRGSSGTVHESDLAIVCDWVEGSVLFSKTTLSKSDMSDVLVDENVYKDQDDANQFVDLVWAKLEARKLLMGAGCPYDVGHRTIAARGNWEDFLPTSYLLVLSQAPLYEKLGEFNLGKYVEQGEIFELFCVEALQDMGWKTLRTGWSSGKGAKKLPAVVAAVTAELCEGVVNADMVRKFEESNEEGCDLVCQRAFPDSRLGRPVYLVQCASGDNWEEKQETPDLELWKKFFPFSQHPQRGFCLPFALEDDEFEKSVHRVMGMLLDRHRLSGATHGNSSWLSAGLKARIKAWVDERQALIPRLT
jgi:hypothetical protein